MLPVREDVLPHQHGADEDNVQNGRRSQRQRFRPLDFWRGERVVYGRIADAAFEAIVDVIVPN